MSAWQERTIEQRNLLNPAFCAIAVWHLARGYRTEATALDSNAGGLPIALAFVGASLVLRGQTRDQLPRTITSSLAASTVSGAGFRRTRPSRLMPITDALR